MSITSMTKEASKALGDVPADFTAGELIVSVTDPVKSLDTFGNSHVTYKVNCRTSNCWRYISVERRYTDFIWFRRELLDLFPGIILPNFPKKTSIGWIKGDFVENRRKSLETFLREVLTRKEMNYLYVVFMFLQGSEKDLERLERKQASRHRATAVMLASSAYAYAWLEDAVITLSTTKGIGGKPAPRPLSSSSSSFEQQQQQQHNASHSHSHNNASAGSATTVGADAVPVHDVGRRSDAVNNRQTSTDRLTTEQLADVNEFITMLDYQRSQPEKAQKIRKFVKEFKKLSDACHCSSTAVILWSAIEYRAASKPLVKLANALSFISNLGAEQFKQSTLRFWDPFKYYYGTSGALTAIKKAVRQVSGGKIRRGSASSSHTAVFGSSIDENYLSSTTADKPAASEVVYRVRSTSSPMVFQQEGESDESIFQEVFKEKIPLKEGAVSSSLPEESETRHKRGSADVERQRSNSEQIYYGGLVDERNVLYEEGAIARLLKDFTAFKTHRKETIVGALISCVNLQIEFHKVAICSWQETLVQVNELAINADDLGSLPLATGKSASVPESVANYEARAVVEANDHYDDGEDPGFDDQGRKLRSIRDITPGKKTMHDMNALLNATSFDGGDEKDINIAVSYAASLQDWQGSSHVSEKHRDSSLPTLSESTEYPSQAKKVTGKTAVRFTLPNDDTDTRW